MGAEEVIFETRGSVAIATLNRPKTLNTLNSNMIHLLRAQYEAWNKDANVAAIVIKAVGGKAFCAGGDVKFAVQQIRKGEAEGAKRFFRNEYELNHFLGHIAKPNIAFIHGIIMGGGAGVSLHGKFRVATEKTLFAMPECAIGLIPDVGASHFLNQLPGQFGTYLAVTGTRLKGYEMVEAGLATHLVSSQKLEQLEEKLGEAGAKAADSSIVERILSSFQAESHEHTRPTGLLNILPDINECFMHDDVESIVEALGARDARWAHEAKKKMSAESPLSQKLTLRSLREGTGKSLATCLKTEYRAVAHIVDDHSDFEEGIRALLIDKDGKPKWRHSCLKEVSEDLVDSFFRPAKEELKLMSPIRNQSNL